MEEDKTTNEAVKTSSDQPTLKRALKLRDLVFYGMIMMTLIAPAAIFGQVEQASGGMTPLVYIVGAVCMLFTALSYKAMSEEFPVGGSVYSYVQRGFNHHVGFIAGWMIMLDYFFVPALLYAMVAAICVSTFPGIPLVVWIILFLVVDEVINIRGIEYTATADLILFFVQLATILVFLICGIKFIADGGGAGSFNIDPIYQPGKINFAFIASACTIAALSFLGFDGISTLADEAIKPKQDIGRAVIIALIGSACLYVIQTYIACLVLPDWQSTDPNAGFFDAAELVAGNWFRVAFVVVVILSGGIANTLVAQSSAARLMCAMGKDKVLPPILSKIHPKYRTPYMALLILGGFSFALAFLMPTATLVRFVNFGAMTSFLMLNVTVFVYFVIKKKQANSFGRIIKYVVCPIVGVVILLYIMSGFEKITYMVGISWLIAGIIIGAVQSKGYKIVPESYKHLDV